MSTSPSSAFSTGLGLKSSWGTLTKEANSGSPWKEERLLEPEDSWDDQDLQHLNDVPIQERLREKSEDTQKVPQNGDVWAARTTDC